MASKFFESKRKYLIIGLFLGILIAKFLPNFFLIKHDSNTKEPNNESFHDKNLFAFAEYSQWPPFLADPTFDLTLWRKHCWGNREGLPTGNPNLYYKRNYTAFNVCKDVIRIVDSIYNMKTNIAKVEYPEIFAQKIRKIFNYDSTLYAKALEQV